MMRYWIGCVLCALMWLCTVSFADAKSVTKADAKKQSFRRDKTPFEEVKSMIIHSRYGFWKGIYLERNSQKVKLGFVGQRYAEVFRGSKDAIAFAKRYNNFMTAGFAVGMASAAMLIVQTTVFVVLPLNGAFGGAFPFSDPVYWGTLIVSLGFSVASGVLVGIGYDSLYKAVKSYNLDLIKYHFQQAASTELSLHPKKSRRCQKAKKPHQHAQILLQTSL